MENSSVVCSLLALLSYHFGVLFSSLPVTYLLCLNKFSPGMQGFGIGVQGYTTVKQGVFIQRAL